MLEAINETVSFIKENTKLQPKTAIILGTGLGKISEEVKIERTIPYEKIPNFPVSTVRGHDGELIIGQYAGKEVMVMNGRFHFYEGYTMEQVIFPIRVLKFLGIENLFISNAAGGMNPDYEVGDVMFINDHINLMPNPLIGRHFPEYGARFPDMSQVYNPVFIENALKISINNQLRAHQGCYVGVTGPTLETPKEYEYMRTIGGDAVGMSTVPEATAAHQMHMNIFAVSVITDLGVPGKIEELTHEMVMEAAEKVTPKLVKVIAELVADLK